MHEDESYRGAAHMKVRCRVRITFNDGATREVEQSLRLSDAISNEEIASKFRTLCEGVVPSDRRDQIEEAVLGLEQERDLSTLFRLLAEDTAPALGTQID